MMASTFQSELKLEYCHCHCLSDILVYLVGLLKGLHSCDPSEQMNAFCLARCHNMHAALCKDGQFCGLRWRSRHVHQNVHMQSEQARPK